MDSVHVLVDVGVKPLPARSFFKLINQWKTVGLPSNFTPTAVQSKLPDATPSRDSSKQDLTTPDDSKEDKLLLTSYAPAAVKIDQPQTNTQIAVANVPLSDVNKDWGSYVAIAEKIRSHIKEKKFLDVTTELVRALDPLVRRVSQLLLQKFPPTTVLFYNLPISITAAKRNEGGGSTWDNVFDHWAIVNTERLFIAWRQDSAYFQVYCDGTEKDGFLATLTEGRKLIK